MKLNRREGILITYALGSCIGITLYDPFIKLGALIHIMLPESKNMRDNNIFKFADAGIEETIRKMGALGGRKERYICKIAGGAQMFELSGGGGIGNIGQRNIESVKKTLTANGIKIVKQDVGSNYARTMILELETGQVRIRTIGKKEIVL